ncbi:MAG: hypothetical protein ABSC08_14420 [Bryobacteraceae bacterium]
MLKLNGILGRVSWAASATDRPRIFHVLGRVADLGVDARHTVQNRQSHQAVCHGPYAEVCRPRHRARIADAQGSLEGRQKALQDGLHVVRHHRDRPFVRL